MTFHVPEDCRLLKGKAPWGLESTEADGNNGAFLIRTRSGALRVPFDTGLRKFGALLGDGVEIGCNAVLNPGSIIGRWVESMIFLCLIYAGMAKAAAYLPGPAGRLMIYGRY